MTYAAMPPDGAVEEVSLHAARRLELMPPGDLPAEIALSPGEAERLRATLRAFLEALSEHCPDRRARAIRALQLPRPATPHRPPSAEASRIPASRAEIDDFDRYFRVTRVAGQTPAATLLAGLLLCAADVTAMAAHAPGLPEEHIARQITGFDRYARLLARVCGLGELQ